MREKLGKTLLIVNPTSQSGKGIIASVRVREILEPVLQQNLDVVFTEAEKHAIKIAAAAEGYDTVIALGGDGVVHETANGLMQIPQEKRPRFGVIPMGSGNDYAKSLGISSTAIDEAITQILTGVEHTVDVGVCNGEYFVETLSFGLDAGIAIKTMELRKTSKKTETALYFDAGIDQLLHHLDTYSFEAELDGRKIQGKDIMFAVQNGVTYGGGFKICPDASLEDGMFDICYCDGPVNVLKALWVFAKAKDGKHTGYKELHFERANSIKLKFDHRPPCQLDGEIHLADSYDISMVPGALRVIMNCNK